VVLVVAGAPDTAGAEAPDDAAVRAALRAARARGLSPGRAAAEVAAATGRPRRQVYALGAEPDDDRPDGTGSDADQPDGTEPDGDAGGADPDRDTA